MRRLANDDDITVAGPVLTLAPRLAETDLIDVASNQGQAHLQAICGRRSLGEVVTDVLVRRGNREWRACRRKPQCTYLRQGFSSLVKRAEQDEILAEKVGLRPDIPPPMFREPLTKATAVVHRRLIASATPEVRAAIGEVLAKVSKEVGPASARATIAPATYRARSRSGEPA